MQQLSKLKNYGRQRKDSLREELDPNIMFRMFLMTHNVNDLFTMYCAREFYNVILYLFPKDIKFDEDLL